MTEVHNKSDEIQETKNLVLCLNCYNESMSSNKEGKDHMDGRPLPEFSALFRNQQEQLEHVETVHRGANDIEFISVWDKKEGGTTSPQKGNSPTSTLPKLTIEAVQGQGATHVVSSDTHQSTQSVSAANANYNLHYYQNYPIQSYHNYYSSSASYPAYPSSYGIDNHMSSGKCNNGDSNQPTISTNQSTSFGDYYNQSAGTYQQHIPPPQAAQTASGSMQNQPPIPNLSDFTDNDNKDDQRYNSIVFANEF